MASKNINLKKLTIGNKTVINLTDHSIDLYQYNKVILSIPSSGLEARLAYLEELDCLYGAIIPILKRTHARLCFYWKGKSVPYSLVQKEINGALCIVSNIALLKAKMILGGNVVSPGKKVEFNGNDNENGGEYGRCQCRVIGTKNFISE